MFTHDFKKLFTTGRSRSSTNGTTSPVSFSTSSSMKSSAPSSHPSLAQYPPSEVASPSIFPSLSSDSSFSSLSSSASEYSLLYPAPLSLLSVIAQTLPSASARLSAPGAPLLLPGGIRCAASSDLLPHLRPSPARLDATLVQIAPHDIRYTEAPHTEAPHTEAQVPDEAPVIVVTPPQRHVALAPLSRSRPVRKRDRTVSPTTLDWAGASFHTPDEESPSRLKEINRTIPSGGVRKPVLLTTIPLQLHPTLDGEFESVMEAALQATRELS